MIRFKLAALALCMGAALCGSARVEASAQPGKTQKVIYPGGRVVYEAVAEKPAPAPAAAEAAAQAPASIAETASTVVEASPVSLVQAPTPADGTALPCAGCADGGTPQPGGECKEYNPPFIIPGSDDDCEGKKVCTDKDNPQKGKLGEVNGGLVKFYKDPCKTFRAVAPIPVIVKNQREEYIFGKAKYGEKCCEYEVCVVTKCCCIDTRECELRNKEVNMRACRRTSGDLIDVYVLNEPGFPEQWVLDLGLSTAAFQAKYPGKPVP